MFRASHPDLMQLIFISKGLAQTIRGLTFQAIRKTPDEPTLQICEKKLQTFFSENE